MPPIALAETVRPGRQSTPVHSGCIPGASGAIVRLSGALEVSCLAPFQLRQPMPELHEGALRLAHLFQAACTNMKIFFRSTATLRCRFAEFGGDETFVFKALQRRINAADCDIP